MYEDKRVLMFSDMPMLTGKLDFLQLFRYRPKCLTLDTWKEWKKTKSVATDDIWDEIPN